ncbi:MAG TPA: translation initiation factor IF-2 [Clostridia bacterium]|nr:translation initiation factor IF-2 [Clostridia bacterium]
MELTALNKAIASAESSIALKKASELEQKRLQEALAREKERQEELAQKAAAQPKQAEEKASEAKEPKAVEPPKPVDAETKKTEQKAVDEKKDKQKRNPGDQKPQQASDVKTDTVPERKPVGQEQARPKQPQASRSGYVKPNQTGKKGSFSQPDRPFNRSASPRRPSIPIIDIMPPAEKEKVSNYDPNKKLYREKPEVVKKPPSKKASLKGGFVPIVDDDDDRLVKNRRKKVKKETVKIEPIKIEHAVMTSEVISIKDLSEKLGKPAAEIIKKLFFLGMIATINQEIDYDTATLIASEFGITLEQKLAKSVEETLEDLDVAADSDVELSERPPVVTVMGHVDHGKTSLLDAIRSTNVTAQEAGGITQHIGAYMINVKGKSITFIDTPGHEAFTAMRARGAQVTDIAILVVAADDGIMPQTVEAINHVKAANVPIIVAINKMDKPNADPERIKQELTEYGLVAEEWGGETIIVPVSAITKQGLDNLLDMILLVAEVSQLKANPNRKAKGTIIEAKLDKGRGPVATVLVQNGTLRIGDYIAAGTSFGRVRAMLDDRGNKVEAATPSMPVEILGFDDVPEAGDLMYVVENEKQAKQLTEERKDKFKASQQKAKAKASLDDLFTQIKEGNVKELNVIVKADVQGSVEAVKQAIEKLSTDKVRVRTIHGGVGAINETDVMFASTSNAIIIGFNVRPDAAARALADKEKIDIRLYRVIYNAIEDIEKAMKGLLEPVYRENVLGHAEVRTLFKVSDVGTIAGSYVLDGKITRNSKVRLLRDNVVVYDGEISSLKRMKDDVREVAAGYECGICLAGYNDIKESDIIEAYVIEQVTEE